MILKKIEEKIPKDMAKMYRRDTQKLDHHRYSADDIASNRRSKKAGSTANKYLTAVAQNNINKFRSLKDAIQNNEKIINQLNSKIDDLNSNGRNSREFSYERNRLAELRKQLASIQQDIEFYEGKLSDDATSKQAAEATDKLNIATNDLSNVKAELNKLLKREGLEHVKEKMLAESFQDDIFNKVWDTLETLSSQEIFTLMSNWFGNLEDDEELVEFANDELNKLDNETLEDAVTSVRGETAAHFFVNWYGRGEFGTEEFAKYMEDEGYGI